MTKGEYDAKLIDALADLLAAEYRHRNTDVRTNDEPARLAAGGLGLTGDGAVESRQHEDTTARV